MSKKSQHNNILLAVIGFTAVVILVGVIGFFTLEQKDDTIQGEVEVSEYRVSCKLPGRVVELRVQEGDYVHVGDTLAILEVPEMKSQEQMLQATNAAAEAMKDLTDAGARKEQIQGAYQLVQQAEAAATIAKKTYDRMQNLFNEGVISGQKRDEAYAAYKATEAQVAAARSQYDMAKNGAREQEKRMAANNTQASKSAVDVVKNLLKETVQIAQCEGEVSNVYPKVGELVGLGSCSVAKGNISQSGTITGDIASDALVSYMGYTGKEDIPKFEHVEIGGGRITGTEISSENPNGVQFAMYHMDQYMEPKDEYSVVKAADGSQWYMQYAVDSVKKEPYMEKNGTIGYNEQIVKKLPDMPKRKDRV